MNDLYSNIGGKIKSWAIAIFVLEALAAIIWGFSLLGNELFLAGVLVLIVGPIVSWISSWLLYAFGELVEKTVENEANTSAILKLLNNQAKAPKAVIPQAVAPQTQPSNSQSSPSTAVQPVTAPVNSGAALDPAEATSAEDGEIICPNCNTKQKSTRRVCWSCGQKFLGKGDPNAPFRCGKCGQDGPYEGPCPSCGSSIKFYN